MVLGCIITLKPPLNPYLVLLMQKYHIGLCEKGSSHLIQQKNVSVHRNKVRRKPHGNKTSPQKWTWSQKYESEW